MESDYSLVIANEKSWVFQLLVKSPEDSIGLIAYSFYKLEKNQYAEKLRANGQSDQEIDLAVKQFHEQVVHTQRRLDAYRDNARTMFSRLLEDWEEEIRKDYQQQLDIIDKKNSEIENLKIEIDKKNQTIAESDIIKSRAIENAKEEAIKEFFRAASRKEKQKTPIALRVLSWIWSGFSGIIASIILFIFLYGMVGLLTTPERKSQIWQWGIESFKSSSPLPPIENSKPQ
ncbi:hypothetical protein [Dickeya fangzhongdai]|uniref:hypothetical protein n=1 Tax=Dickeya fangzhongdai TaxID=1778540 RepID=UPI001ADC6851|nr:hypothetical protein [Dickeya fangzhongdai]MBO8135568.1 hypothetical protein [Dickeya fangzhongdai]